VIKKNIPNFITICNLLCGCLAISNAFEERLYISSYFLFAALWFDFLDGFTARLLKVSNPLGEQLDSLADMVAFGLAPGMLLYQFTKEMNQIPAYEVPLLTNNPWLFYTAFAIPVFSAIRLAKFNIDTRQTSSFIGLPTPANASFFLFPVLIYHYKDVSKLIDVNAIILPVITNPLVMLSFGIVLSLLLVAEIPMCSLKFKNLKWKDNQQPFSFILLWSVLLILTHYFAMPAIVLIYILWSIFKHIISPKKITD